MEAKDHLLLKKYQSNPDHLEIAKISFKAGQESVKRGDVCAHCTKKVLQDGMKKVVNWIKSNATQKEREVGIITVTIRSLQDFLRKNGLEESK